MANPDYLILAVGVGALVIVIIVGAVLQQPQALVPSEPDCPEPEPVPRITPEDADAVLAASYANLELWEYGPTALLKWCQTTAQWWISTNADGSTYLCTAGGTEVLCSLALGGGNHSFGPWRVLSGATSSAVTSYADSAQTDLVLFVLSPSFLGAPPLLDEAYVVGENSLLVAKERVG